MKHCVSTPTRKIAFLLFAILAKPITIFAWNTCPTGHGICPDGNTCCYNPSDNTTSCISGKNHQGECCTDQAVGTGCSDGYVCAVRELPLTTKDTDVMKYYCQKTEAAPDPDTPDQLPRYRTCRVPVEALQHVYGLPVSTSKDAFSTEFIRRNGKSLYPSYDGTTNNKNKSNTPQLAYLSTMGSLDSGDPVDLQKHLRVETIVITIHGSGRNADDYLCGTQAAVPLNEQDYNNSTVLVIAPWFRAPSDQLELMADFTYLQREKAPHQNKEHRSFNNLRKLKSINFRNKEKSALNDDEDITLLAWNEFGPIFHTWRYGADAVNAPVSSYTALDALIDRVTTDKLRFANLKRIIVTGHSAGGQYVQRWGLLSKFASAMSSTANSGGDSNSVGDIEVRLVVANPKSFCFLDARRYINDTFRIPDQDDIDQCDTYNGWEWGLGEGNYLPTPYKDAAIEQEGGTDAIVNRYATRSVVYLAGELDVIPNGDCEARTQGAYRRERSEHFFASLDEIYKERPPQHHRQVVKHVHHDHCLMYQSPEGFEALFGGFDTNQNEFD